MSVLDIALIVAVAAFILAWLILFIPFAIETHRMGKQLREMKRDRKEGGN